MEGLPRQCNVTTALLQDGFRLVIHVRETSKSLDGDDPRSSRRPGISTFAGEGARIVRSDVHDGVVVTVRGVRPSRSSLGLGRRLSGSGGGVGLGGPGLTSCGGGRAAIQAGVVFVSHFVEVDGPGRGGVRGGHDSKRWYGRVRGRGRWMDCECLAWVSSATLQINDLRISTSLYSSVGYGPCPSHVIACRNFDPTPKGATAYTMERPWLLSWLFVAPVDGEKSTSPVKGRVISS